MIQTNNNYFVSISNLIRMTYSEITAFVIALLTAVGTIGGLWLGSRTKAHDVDIKALQDAVKSYQTIITEKDKLIEVYKRELDELLEKCDHLQARNETLSAEIEQLKTRIFELEKN